MFFEQLLEHPVGREVALFRDLVQDTGIHSIVFVERVFADSEEIVWDEPVRLMNLEIKADVGHGFRR